LEHFVGMQTGIALVLLLLFCTWAFGVLYKDASLVDRVWGLGFILAMFGYLWEVGTVDWRAGLTFIAVTIWGGRLSIYLHLRNRGKPEDYRYTAMRQNTGPSFVWKSLIRVNLLQAVILLLVASPLYVIAQGGGAPFPAVTDVIGFTLFGIGLMFEVVGDYQLKAFKKDPKNKGQVLRTGLWSLTRHPNYFGDALLWWGLWTVSLASPKGLVTFFAPLLMTVLLRRVSGVSLLEKDLVAKKPGYASYVAEVPAFFPRLWPKG